MTQQYSWGTPSDKYKKKLFVQTGRGYEEVKARIIEPYTPPTPSNKVKEIELLNAPSDIHGMGIKSYKATVPLLFDSKDDYVYYLSYVGWTHKFYDERGAIFVGTVESVKTTSVEGHKRYKVEVELILVKKDQYDTVRKVYFQDVTVDVRGIYEDFELCADLGIINTYDDRGNPVLYFYPYSWLSRSTFMSMMVKTKNLIESALSQ